MSRDEIEKLLGGYATDTLTEAERSALFAAALEDQELFDALAKEQALREVLQEPSARRQLMEALLPARQPLGARMWRWLRQPAALALTGGIAALLIVAGFALYQAKHAMTRLVTTADVSAPAISVPAPTLPPAVSPLILRRGRCRACKSAWSARLSLKRRPPAAPQHRPSQPHRHRRPQRWTSARRGTWLKDPQGSRPNKTRYRV